MEAKAKLKPITDFFTPSAPATTARINPESICHSIVDELVDQAVARATKKKARHTGGLKVQQSTEKQWQQQYPWLQIRDSQGGRLMFCLSCETQKKKNNMATKGSPNVQLSTIKSHEISSEHRDTVRIHLKRPHIDDLPDSILDTELNSKVGPSSASESDKLIFRTVYFCAKSELPSETINKLLEYDKINGLEPEMQNLSWTTINDMQQIISKCLQREIADKIKDSEVFGIMIDESCDIGVEKKLVVCVRYFDNVKGETATAYLASTRVNDGKAHTITTHVQEMLQSLGLNLTKIVGLGTDGAAAMTGRKMGVGVQVKSKMAPFVTQVHCFAHRLALGTIDALKGIKELETFKSNFNMLYIHFSSSAVRTAKLREIQGIFEDPELKLKEPHAVRWLSLRKAVETVVRCYPSVVAALSELAEQNSTAKGLHKYFKMKKTAILASIMWDIHEEIAAFSCCLQKDNLIYSEIKPKLEATLAGLQTLRDGGAHRLETCRELEDGGLKGLDLQGDLEVAKRSVTTLVNRYIDGLQENLKDRLTQQDGDTLCNLSAVLSPQLFDEDMADGSIEELGELYGTEKVTKRTEEVDDVIQETRVAPLLDKEQLKVEWPRLKAMIKGTYRTSTMKALCKHVTLLHSDVLPNISMLCKVAMCICVTSVSCERAFSFQNRLKTKFRASLKEENLDNLMRIAIQGPEMKDYDPCPAVRLWRRVKPRRDKRLMQPYKARV